MCVSCSFNTAAAQDPVDHQLQLVSQSAAVKDPADLCVSALVLVIFPPILTWMLFDSCFKMKKDASRYMQLLYGVSDALTHTSVI